MPCYGRLALDQLPSRGDQALAALDNVVRDPRVSSRVDRTRLAVAGWSMGGEGDTIAPETRHAEA